MQAAARRLGAAVGLCSKGILQPQHSEMEGREEKEEERRKQGWRSSFSQEVLT